MIAGQQILARFDKTQIRFFPEDWYTTPPGRPYHILVNLSR